jgi:hypothetical protein
VRVLITGGTGFIGAALVKRLLGEGHDVSVVTRAVDRLASRLGPQVEGVGHHDRDALAKAVEWADAVVNLAGERIVGARWTANQKRKLRASRIELTETLVKLMGEASNRPEVFISASAVGFYGDTGELVCDETTAPGDDFLAQLCIDWERAASGAKDHGVRVAIPRIGIVLGENGGALEKMLPAFRMGFGGVLGSGDQYLSWIHRDDLICLLMRVLRDRSIDGPFNATAPVPVTNREFTRALGDILKRPTLLPVPKFALKLVLGESSVALLTGQRAIPSQAQSWGYEFEFETVSNALSDVLLVSQSMTSSDIPGHLS